VLGSVVNCATAFAHAMHIAKVAATARVLTLEEVMDTVCHTWSFLDP